MKLHNFIICDDIRAEVGNKHSLIGVYSSGINFNITPDKANQWPRTIKRLCVFSCIGIEKADAWEKINSFTIELSNEKEMTVLGETILPPKSDLIIEELNLTGAFNNLKIPSSGIYKFCIKFYDTAGKVVCDLPIERPLKVSESVIS